MLIRYISGESDGNGTRFGQRCRGFRHGVSALAIHHDGHAVTREAFSERISDALVRAGDQRDLGAGVILSQGAHARSSACSGIEWPLSYRRKTRATSGAESIRPPKRGGTSRMAFALDAEQLQIQDLVRRVAREKVAPRANEIDRTAEYPQDMFELLRELGLFALPFPQSYGGTGSTLSACVVVEELAR